jgi:hypothetical protein
VAHWPRRRRRGATRRRSRSTPSTIGCRRARVNIDDDGASVELQNAYAANARVMTAIRELLEMLMKM